MVAVDAALELLLVVASLRILRETTKKRGHSEYSEIINSEEVWADLGQFADLSEKGVARFGGRGALLERLEGRGAVAEAPAPAATRSADGGGRHGAETGHQRAEDEQLRFHAQKPQERRKRERVPGTPGKGRAPREGSTSSN